MVRKRNPYPEYGELVIGTVTKIFDHGAFVSLDEYGGLEAYCPLNEVSRSWFKGIREVLKEGQKFVFKVIRVDRKKGHVDVSLRRVGEDERREKLSEFRRAQRAEKLLELAAKSLGKTLDEAYDKAGWKLEDYYGEIYAGFEEAAKRGVEALLEAGVDKEWAEVLAKLAKAYVEIPIAKVSGIFQIRCLEPDGILRIKKALLAGLEVAKKYNEVKVRIYTEGAPRYKIDLIAPDYKIAERSLRDIVNTVLKVAQENKCIVSFKRIKLK